VGFAADITDQRQAAHRLRAMANMLDVAPNSITVHDLAGRFLYANRKSIELHRYSDEAEFLAVNLHDLDVPESAALIDTRIKEAAMAGDARFEVEHFRRDGTRIPLEVFIKTVSWDGVPGIISVATDLTERRAAEEQLRLQALVLDQISDHVTVTDLQGNILYVNEAECRMFGRPRQSIVGQHVRSYGEDRARGAGQDQIIEKTLAQGRWHGEVINYASDGNERIIECRTTLVHDKDGRPIAICGIGTDIGDRKKAEAQLRASEERYRSLVNNIGLGVVLIGSDYRIRSANPAQARLFGKSVEDLVGRECYREFEKRDDVCPGCPGKIALSTGQPHEVDRQGVHDDGLTHLARVRAFPLLDASGCADAFVEVTEDVTQRRQLEIEYRQAQKMEAVGRLAAGVAHDFNNQLTVIQGYSEVLLGRCPEGDPLFEPLSQIRQAAKRAHSTTSHLLSFSRKQILEPGVVDLRDFLNESQAPIARMIGEDITLDVIVDPVCPPVLIDKSGLHQAIMNLVVNARDAMPDGGALALRASGFELAAGEAHEFAEASPGRYVLLEVIDSGLGMSSQTMEHAFEPFFTTKEAGKGTGLGLPMVLGFVRQSKGYLAIRSECGKGTTVRMLLPLARREPEDPIDAAEAVAPTDLHPGRTVLLTEDEEGVRTLLTSILEQSGYRVLSAARPTEAIRISREYEGLIDLLISDVTMPEMPGNELAKVVRSSRPGIRVLLITGYAEHARQTEEEVLQKPFTMKELLDRVVAMIPVEPHP
jgi:PAS domain S-box-containing protein